MCLSPITQLVYSGCPCELVQYIHHFIYSACCCGCYTAFKTLTFFLFPAVCSICLAWLPRLAVFLYELHFGCSLAYLYVLHLPLVCLCEVVSPFSPLDSICSIMMVFWKLRWNVPRTAVCCVVYDSFALWYDSVFISDLWPIWPDRQLGLCADIHERKVEGYAHTQ